VIQLMIKKTAVQLKEDKFTFIASDQTIDRDGDQILYESWDTTNYEKNNVIMWAHSYDQLPIGKGTLIKDNIGKRLLVKIEFAFHEFAQTVKKLVQEGFLNTLSVGFLGQGVPNDTGGKKYTSTELLEISVVPIPSNFNSLALRGKGFTDSQVKMLQISPVENIEIEESVLDRIIETEINEYLK